MGSDHIDMIYFQQMKLAIRLCLNSNHLQIQNMETDQCLNFCVHWTSNETYVKVFMTGECEKFQF